MWSPTAKGIAAAYATLQDAPASARNLPPNGLSPLNTPEQRGSNLLIGLTASLEVQLQSELNDARRTRSRDLAKGGTPSLVVWVMKLCVVEGVEEL